MKHHGDTIKTTMSWPRAALGPIVVVIGLLVAGCGSGGSSSSTDTTVPPLSKQVLDSNDMGARWDYEASDGDTSSTGGQVCPESPELGPVSGEGQAEAWFSMDGKMPFIGETLTPEMSQEDFDTAKAALDACVAMGVIPSSGSNGGSATAAAGSAPPVAASSASYEFTIVDATGMPRAIMWLVVGYEDGKLVTLNGISPADPAFAEQQGVGFITTEEFNAIVAMAGDKLG